MGKFDKYIGSLECEGSIVGALPKPDTIVVNLEHSHSIRRQYKGFKYVKLLYEGHEYTYPAQAFMDFLERLVETCHTVPMDCFGNPPYNQSGLAGNSTAVGCSECGAPWSTMGIFRGNQLKHNFKACPICGRRVAE